MLEGCNAVEKNALICKVEVMCIKKKEGWVFEIPTVSTKQCLQKNMEAGTRTRSYMCKGLEEQILSIWKNP